MAKPVGKSPKPESSNDTSSQTTAPTAHEPKSVSAANGRIESTPDMESNPRVELNERSEANTKMDAVSASPVAKKEPAKPKKPLLPKSSSLLPSPQKLDHLKAAVLAAGTADNLITILQHVDDAGGRKEVLESIEAYRILKTVLEES